ncbi:MAG: hypothetical protein EA401_08940 [Planctomycetota bacterium]|nr:MAG: hypothetical protein EA401_08940 [Planctomycetota bacterium]
MALIVAALGSYLIYVWPHLQRRIIGAPLGDTPHILMEHQDRVYHYSLRMPTPDNPQNSIGSFSQRLGFLDTFYTVDSSFRLDRDHGIPQLMALNTWGIDSTLRVDMRLEIDDRWRPVGVSGNLRFARTIIDIIGSFSHHGLDGEIILSDQNRRPFHLQDVGGTHALAFHPALALPTDLAVGDRFSLPILQATATPPFVTSSSYLFVVDSQESLPTAAGPMPCLRVEVFHHGERMLSLWADQQGVIYRLGNDHALMHARLERITNQAGDPLWPPQELP